MMKYTKLKETDAESRDDADTIDDSDTTSSENDEKESEILLSKINEDNTKICKIRGKNMETEKLDYKAIMILIGSALGLTVAAGFGRTFGIYYLELLDLYDSGPIITNLVVSTYFATSIVAGPVAAFLMRKFRTVYVIVSLGLMSFSGHLFTAVTSNIILVVIFIGFIHGMGIFGICCCVATTINTYFTKYQGLANSVTIIGAGIGTLIFPLLANHLTTQYGSRGMFIIMAAVSLHGCLCALLFVHIDWSNNRNADDFKDEKNSNLTKMCNTNSSKKRGLGIFFNKIFIAFIFLLFSYHFMFLTTQTYLPAYSTEVGLSEWIGNITIAVIGLSEILVRIIEGFVFTRYVINREVLMSIGAIISIINILLLILMPYEWMFYIFGAIFGAIGSLHYVYAGPIFNNLVGKENMAEAFGIVYAIYGISGCLSPIIIGVIKDISGYYVIGLALPAVIIGIGALLFFIVRVRK